MLGSATDVDVLAEDFQLFLHESGMRTSQLTGVLDAALTSNQLDTPLSYVAVSTPPQEGKTTYLVHWLAWQLLRNPRLRIIYCSYSQMRANAVSKQVRALVARWLPGMAGRANVAQWLTPAGGQFLAAGRGTGVTGFSCDLLVIDDPIKDMLEAQSELIRTSVVDHFSSVLLTRMAALALVVVVCTRWHRDDLIAHVVKLGARYINVPAQSTVGADGVGDPLGRPGGVWLQSVQGRTEEAWQAIKQAVGPYVWHALYQGNPKPVGDRLIDVQQLGTVPWIDICTQQGGIAWIKVPGEVYQSWDLAFTGRGDYVCGQVWLYDGHNYFLLENWRQRVGFQDTVDAAQRMAARWPQTARVLVEQAANGAALIDTLRGSVVGVQPVSPRSSKEVRALACQPLVAAGRVKVTSQAYSDTLWRELEEFPLAKHDDQVDAFTQALLYGHTDYYSIGH